VPFLFSPSAAFPNAEAAGDGKEAADAHAPDAEGLQFTRARVGAFDQDIDPLWRDGVDTPGA